MPLIIEENFTAKLLEQLRDNELDVAVVALPVDLHGLNAWPLYDEDFVVLLPQDHRWVSEKQVPAKRLAEESLGFRSGGDGGLAKYGSGGRGSDCLTKHLAAGGWFGHGANWRGQQRGIKTATCLV